MAIETSVSPLAQGYDEEEEFEPLERTDEEAEEIEERTPAPKPKANSLQQALIDQIDDDNLARYLDDSDLDRIGMEVVRQFEIDDNSRQDWLSEAKEAIRMASQKTRPKQFPWPGASSFIYPLIAEAALDFHARTYPAIVQGRAVVKGVVWGSDRGTPATQDGKKDGKPITSPGPDGQPQPVWLVMPGEKRKRADRVGEHMSWQLLEEMPEWEPQTDALLLQLPVVGGAVRKTFRDQIERRNSSLFVSLLNIVWNYHAPCFEQAPRVTEKILLYPSQITELERSEDEGDGGLFLPLMYGPGGGGDGVAFNTDEDPDGGMEADDDAPHMFLEQHCRLDLDNDGYAEPYIVTVHLRSAKVVRIKARYLADGIDASPDGNTIYKIKADELYTLYRFLPSIDGGSYPMGLGHLLRTLNEGINTSFNQLFDAGTLANTQSGFISNELNIPSGQAMFQVGKYIRVNTKGAAIRDSVLPLPFPGPNTVLFQVLGTIVTAAEKVAGIGNILTGDAAIANAPPTTVLALIEQGMKFYTAIVKRVFRAEKVELNKLYDLNRRYLTETQHFHVGDEECEIDPEDYRLGGGVKPVADPTQTTDMQRLGRAQVVMSTAQDPLVNRKEALRRLYEAAGIDRIDDLFAPPDPMAAAAGQLAMAKAQAELGAERAKELKDQSQAFLNMALARKNASAQEQAWIEAQLDFLRLHIEALNTTVNAAAVDHKFHDTGMKATTARAQMAADQAAQQAAAAQDQSQSPDQPTPGPTGPFPTGGPSAPVGPDVVTPSSVGTGNTNVPGPGPSGPPGVAPSDGGLG